MRVRVWCEPPQSTNRCRDTHASQAPRITTPRHTPSNTPRTQQAHHTPHTPHQALHTTHSTTTSHHIPSNTHTPRATIPGTHHTPTHLEAALRREYPGAEFHYDHATLKEWVELILRHLSGELPSLDLPLDIRATAFERRVWEQLKSIPYGATRSYSEIAQEIGQPTATRAVANACGSNPVPLLIPCHRVVRKDGGLGGYGGGIERKKALLDRERKHAVSEVTSRAN